MAVIKVENLSKIYRLGEISTGTFFRDFERWFARMRGKPDPYTRIGEADHGNRESDEIWALRDVSFEVEQGEVLGIIGRNGAGKSTLLKILSRVTAPTSGQIKVKGRIASLLEVGTGFHPELTGRENIYLNGAILGMTKAEVRRKFDEIVDFAGVEQYIDTPVKRYSSGMHVRLAFAVAAHLEPEILVVDEVLAVGDAEFQKKCLGKMGEVARGGRTVLFVSHNMAAVENLCQKVAVIDKGHVVQQGTSANMIDFYLQNIMLTTIEATPLLKRADRSGNGKLKLSSFHVEDVNGRPLSAVRSGADAILVFGYLISENALLERVDVGFSIHSNISNSTLFVLYSSYVGKTFDGLPPTGEFCCHISKLPLAPGRYRVGARVTSAGEELDWPQNGIGYLDVEMGDFYGTGSQGFGNSSFLVSGSWYMRDTECKIIMKEL